MLSRKLSGQRGPAPLGLFPTYCVSQDDHLLLMFHWGGRTIVRTGLGRFVDHEVTTNATLSQDHVLLARARVLELSTIVPAADEFEPGKDLIATGSGVIISGASMALHKIRGSVPVYPETEREARNSGTVILQGVIGTDGHVIDLVPMSAPDALFAESALAAVRDWTYTPYLLNGVPTEVTTTITVNYSINPR